LKKAFLYLFFCFVTVYQIDAQNRTARFTSYTVSDGLSQNRVYTILQDSKGFLWIGTEDGLNKYDSYGFEKYYNNEFDNKSLAGNIVRCIFEDSQGNLYIGTNDGISQYKRETNDFVTIRFENIAKNIDPEPYVWSLAEKDKDNLWVGTMFGLYSLNKRTKKFTQVILGLGEGVKPNIYSILQLPSSDILVGTVGGLFLNNKEGKFLKYFGLGVDSISLNNQIINKIFIDSRKMVWLATDNKLHRYFPEQQILKTVTLPYNQILSITEDDAGLLWLSTSNGVIAYNVFTNKSELYQSLYFEKLGLTGSYFNYIYKDKGGLIWIGGDKGLFKYDRLFQMFYSIKRDGSSAIVEFFEDSIKEMEKSGAIKFLSKNTKDLMYSKYIPSLNITSVLSMADGKLLMAMKTKGLTLYNPNEKRFMKFVNDKNKPNNISSNNITNIYRDSLNNIWICTSNGISLFDTVNFTFNNLILEKDKMNFSIDYMTQINHSKYYLTTNTLSIWDRNTGELVKFTHPDFKPKSSILQVLIDFEGNHWFASRYDGLYKFSPKTNILKQYLPEEGNKNSFSHFMTYCIKQDSKKRIWIGTKIGGLNRYIPENDNFEVIREKDGLSSNMILSIEEDKKGNLWMSTGRGITKYNPDTKTINNYDTYDGLDENNYFSRSSGIDKNGWLYFGGFNGVNYFHPDSLTANPYPPIVVFTSFFVNNKLDLPTYENSVLKRDISETDSITLTWRENIFMIEFAGLHFSNPGKNRFQYKLDGFDKDWVEASSKKHWASYSNIPQGEYIFKVKAANADGVWSTVDKTLYIKILPPFWETWWFRILVVLVVGGSAYGFYYIRISNIQKQKSVLESKNNEVTKAYGNLQIVSDFGQKVTATLNVGAINSLIFDYVRSLVDVSGFGIGLVSKEMNLISFSNFIDNDIKTPFFQYKLTDKNNPVIWVIDNKKELFLNDYERGIGDYISDLFVFKNKSVPKSIIYLPLILEHRCIGVMCVHANKVNAFNQNDITNIQTLASYISIAFDNAFVYDIVKTKNEMISGSIRYAKTIQQAILPVNELKKFEHFILFRPRDVVSGDFYWAGIVSDTSEMYSCMVAVLDCTGHGVPGAFMSMIGYSLMNKIVNEDNVTEPSEVLFRLNASIQKALKQDTTDNQDGMDVCLVRINKPSDSDTIQLAFAGAKRPLFYFSAGDNTTGIVPGTVKSIGGIKERSRIHQFEQTNLELSSGSCIYLSSDGFTDQNDNERKRYGKQKLLDTLLNYHNRTMKEQRVVFETSLVDFMNGADQRDDVTLLGIRL